MKPQCCSPWINREILPVPHFWDCLNPSATKVWVLLRAMSWVFFVLGTSLLVWGVFFKPLKNIYHFFLNILGKWNTCSTFIPFQQTAESMGCIKQATILQHMERSIILGTCWRPGYNLLELPLIDLSIKPLMGFVWEIPTCSPPEQIPGQIQPTCCVAGQGNRTLEWNNE